MRKIFTFLFLSLLSHSLLAAGFVPGHGLRFTQNKGQLPGAVRFSAELPQGWLFAEQTSFTYNFLEPAYFLAEELAPAARQARSFQGHAFKVHFAGANPRARITTGGQVPGYANYFIGTDPAKWATGVPAYQQLHYQELFPHIDLSLYTQDENLKYDFIVAPGGRVADIRMQYEGAQQLALRNGRLYIRTAVNEIYEEKPFAYQLVGGRRKAVPCVFTLQDQVVGFRITGAYDPAIPLVIDPALVFSTYSGSKSQLSANSATADAAGNTYVASHMLSTHYPITTGVYQTVRKGGNLAIAKLDAQGSSQLFATFLGGSSREYPLTLTVNAQQELVVLAHTTSADFPVTPGSYDQSFNGEQDYVVAKLSADGKTLLAATFLGGKEIEGGNNLSDMGAGLTLDATGNIYVSGTTKSLNFPVVGGFQTTKQAGNDGIVAKFNSTLSTLIWSTYLGGSYQENISDLKVSATTGKVVVAGTSTAFQSSGVNNFPTTAGVVTKSAPGMNDGFVAVLSPAGNVLLAATFVGTSQQDLLQFVELDQQDNVYVAGFTRGSYPITAGTYGTASGVGGYFIHKLNALLTATLFSTHIGNNSVGAGAFLLPVPTAFQVDNCNNIYLSGYAMSGLPVTEDALQKERRSLYLLHLSGNAKSLAYATFLGGNSSGNPNSHIHPANHSLITEAGTLHHVECTTFSDYPVTASAHSSKNSGNGNDAAVSKFQFTPLPGLFLKAQVEPPGPSCGPYTVSFANKSENAISYSWNFSDGSPESADPAPVHTFREPGTYKVRLIAANPAGCKVLDTTYVEVVVQSPPAPALLGQIRYLCQPTITLDAGNPGYTYLWSTGAVEQTLVVSEPGTYSVTTRLGNCQINEQITVAAPLPPVQAPNIFTPNHDGRNETFAISNLAPHSRLKVFSRWGKLVYQSDNYQNDWDGRHLSVGTYYYYVDSPGACTTQKGWVELAK